MRPLKQFITHYTRHLLVLSLVFSLFVSSSVYARPINLETDQPRVAKVLEVIDGEVIRVRFYYSDFTKPEVKVIKLIGIDTKGNQEAYEYSLSALLGKVVFILEDSQDHFFPVIEHLDMSYGYVYNKLSRSINEEMLMNGYAQLDEAYEMSDFYTNLLDAEAVAIDKELGYHSLIADDVTTMFNINTASFTTMTEHLVDTEEEAIHAIINYRDYNMFNSIEEVKYAHESLDSEWFKANKGIYSTVTNLNEANTYELSSLFSKDDNPVKIAESIEQYKVFNTIYDKSEMRFIEEVSRYYYDIDDFIDAGEIDFYIDPDHKVANINTCNISELIEATGLTDAHGAELTKQRLENDYYYKSVGEAVIPNAALSGSESFRYTDNLSAFTDINNAGTFELISLFSVYSELNQASKEDLAEKIVANRPYEDIYDLEPLVKPYFTGIRKHIMVDIDDIPDSLNLNIASFDILDEYVGLNSRDESLYRDFLQDYTYTNPFDIRFNIRSKGSRISLYTNINTASAYELLHLNENMNEDIVKDILEFRAKEPITSADEISFIFSEHKRQYIFTNIKDVLVYN